MCINLNNYSFDEWLEFVFNHPVNEIGQLWYLESEWKRKGDAEHIIKYCIRLFHKPEFLLEKYSPEQIDQGFWFLLGASGQLEDWLWDGKIDWNLREECIRSMINVFERLFTKNHPDSACHMWWDLIIFNKTPDPKVEEAMFQALSQIIKIDSLACQISALHGFGHLEHEGKKEVIENFLETHPNIDAETQKYALVAIEGRVQ